MTSSRNHYRFGDRCLENQQRPAQKLARVTGDKLGPASPADGQREVAIVENELPTLDELQDQSVAAAEAPENRGSSLPLLLTMGSILIWFAFQTVQLIVDRSNLSAVKANFESAMQESQKMQSQLQSLVSKTVELAQQGNPAAKAAVEELEKRGMPIKGAAAQPAK